MHIQSVGHGLPAFFGKIEGHLSQVFGLLPNLLIAIAILVIFYYLSVLFKVVITKFLPTSIIAKALPTGRHNLMIVLRRLSQSIIMAIGVFLALVTIAPSLQLKDFISALGIGGVAFGFAFKDILQNFLSGILILLTEPFVVGDQIIVGKGNYEGTVTHINTRSTYIKTYDGRRVVIPNSDLYTGSITVNTAYDIKRNEFTLSVENDLNLESMKQKIKSSLLSTNGVLTDPEPKIEAITLAESGIELRVFWWCKSSYMNQIEVKNNVIHNLCKAPETTIPECLTS